MRSGYLESTQGSGLTEIHRAFGNSAVRTFTGTHPQVMQEKIARENPCFKYDARKATWRLKDRIMQPIEDFLGICIGEYKNYMLL